MAAAARRRTGRASRGQRGPLRAALTLNIGGLVVLYFTPLYVATTTRPALHLLVHLHFLLAGYLFAWVIAGPDPAPDRPSVPLRLVVLGLAIAGHSVISQLIYAGLFVRIPVQAYERRGAGESMYYLGDIAELLLALALLLNWRPRRERLPTASRACEHEDSERKTLSRNEVRRRSRLAAPAREVP